MSFCHHFESVVRPSTITKTYSPLKPVDQTLVWNGPWVTPFQNCIRQSRPPTNMAAATKNKKGMKFKKIFMSETTGTIGTKLCLNSPWMIPFQNCVRKSRPPTNMATVAKNRKRGMNFFPSETTGPIGSKFAKKIL